MRIEKRNTERYGNLAKVDFKCLEQNHSKKLREEGIRNTLKILFDKINAPIIDAPKDYYTFWKHWKEEKGPDLDDSGGKSPFMRVIYYILWGKRFDEDEDTKVFTSFSKSYVFPFIKNSSAKVPLPLGGDTMNTIKYYQKQIENLKKQNGSEVDELCKMAHRIGNFVLVPAYYNGQRGGLDRFDIGLYKLKAGGYYNFRKGLNRLWARSKGIDEEEKEKRREVVNNRFEDWSVEDFERYINVFFLWDYVKPDSNKKYQIKSIKSEILKLLTKEEMEKGIEISAEEIGTYIRNATKYISKRSIFMAGMLMIAIEENEYEYKGEHKDQWEDWKVSGAYKLIVDKVFLTDNTYENYTAVINKILEIVRKEINDRELKEEIAVFFSKIIESETEA